MDAFTGSAMERAVAQSAITEVLHHHASLAVEQGRWRNIFRREDDGRWLLTSKHPIAEGFSPQGWVATVLLASQAGAS